MFVSVSANGQWVQSYYDSLDYFYSINGMENYIYAGSYGVHGILKTTNNGNNWNIIPSGIYSVMAIGLKDFNVFVASQNGLYYTSNNGLNWLYMLNRNVLCISIQEDVIAIGTKYNGIGISTNNGTNWSFMNLNQLYTNSVLLYNSNYIAGTDSGIAVSTNNGVNWIKPLHVMYGINTIMESGNIIYAGGLGVFKSTNNGLNWELAGLENKEVYVLAKSGTLLMAGTYGNGFFISTDNGNTWIEKNQGLPFGGKITVYSIYSTPDVVFLGSNYYIYKRSIYEIIGIENVYLPVLFYLRQNYPNPFNPVTTIEFSVWKNTDVKISVYDVTGKEVAVLVNGYFINGVYLRDWDASAYPSGVYFYRMVADGFSETRKMVLIR